MPRKRTFAVVAATALATAGAAVAAFLLYSGLSGSAGGNFAGTSTVDAITVSAAGPASADLGPGGTVTLPLTLQNDDPGAAEKIVTLTASVTTSPDSSCAAHLLVSGTGGIEGTIIPAGGSSPASVGVQADASLPSSCAGGSYLVSFTGTTAAQ